MNINDYISSGILEQYVSGTASAQERQEVECMSHIYPEIHTELIAIQDVLEAMAFAEAKTPPISVRKNIFDTIDALEKENVIKINAPKANIVSIEPITTSPKQEEVATKVDTRDGGLKFKKSGNNFRAAAALLFLVSSGLGYLLYNANQKSSHFEQDLAVVKKEIQNQTKALDQKNTQLAVVQNKAFSPITMAGIPAKSPTSKATIYWNKSSKEVFISVDRLPIPMEGKQYQLWAIADGKPVDLGMIEKGDIAAAFQKMKTIDNPSAFAVTLEKEGGVESPTMTEMYVMGGV
jgi:Anti-sigma-K factor rskA